MSDKLYGCKDEALDNIYNAISDLIGEADGRLKQVDEKYQMYELMQMRNILTQTVNLIDIAMELENIIEVR